MDQLIAFHRTFGSCVLGPPQKDYSFAVPWRGSFGHILTMQLERTKKEAAAEGLDMLEDGRDRKDMLQRWAQRLRGKASS